MSADLGPLDYTAKLVAGFEGFSATAYLDTDGLYHIGYGFLATGPAEKITEPDAYAELLRLLGYYFSEVEAATRGIGSENQLAAMTSLEYNIGVSAFRTSSVLRFHNQQMYAAAADAFLLWDKEHVDGVLRVSDALLERRKKERLVYKGAAVT